MRQLLTHTTVVAVSQIAWLAVHLTVQTRSSEYQGGVAQEL